MTGGADRRSGLGFSSRRALVMAGATCAGAAVLPAHATSVDWCPASRGAPATIEGRIVYVDQSGTLERPIRRVAFLVRDRGSETASWLTRGDAAVLTPRLSPSGRDIAWASASIARDGTYVSRVHLMDGMTGKSEVIGDPSGTTYSPRFSPDGRTLAVAMARDGRTNLYAIDLAARAITRLTDAAGIDTAPCYSPDGQQICFESDREGSQQIYLMSACGGSAQRITSGGANHLAPAWSPRGDMIAFTRIDGADIVVGVMRSDGSGQVVLARGSVDSAAVFAPDGQALMFSRAAQGAGPSLFTVGLDGCGESRVATPGFALDPDWLALVV